MTATAGPADRSAMPVPMPAAPASASGAPDPVTLAVLDNRLRAIVEEMGEAMLRTSYSQILNSSRDFSIALCDAEGRLVAQADHIPVHVGAMPWAAKAAAEAFAGDIRPGDTFLLNDPYHGGSHLPDLTIIIPVFAEGVLRFWSVVRAHQSDIGGATHGGYNPGATEIWQEGLRIPPIRLGEGGALREDLIRMLATNTRIPRDFRGDLMAMIGAARLGEQRLQPLLAKYGAAAMQAAVSAILDLSEAHARRLLAAWPDGTWLGEAFLDDDGFGRQDIAIRARCTKRGDSLTVDLTESDPQATGFVNSSYPNMRSATAMAFAFLLDPEVAKNDGAFRPLEVVAKEGTVVWAREGAPVTMCTSHCSNEIVEAIIRALQHACPERAMGGWGRRFRVAITGQDARRPGRRFVWHMFHARPGGGGSSRGDGWSTAGEWHSAGGLKFGSVEMAEARFPLLFERHEFLPGSAGDGRHRGGLGGQLILKIESVGPCRANTAGDGVRHGAAGMLGGQDGRPHHYRLRHADGTERVLKTKEVGIPVEPGDRLLVEAGGGGGWGPSEQRSPEARARDAAEGYV
ncbi:hydantoinase B/oxoprolinase family protein [Paracraurococcus lichenis]|uniref:Hydantoinase B/oxoprolinase family protein n=1 Tax=Paracraurococcus lichenis TaxID=3064888 RepID=A0ABT9DVY9_9PROT|nr:hydantoinase B/oxoprolinase family protein [Paracraurococcus sp. LOR1-02]MDO9708071.1 hydantoinase B/oxoprolinase family protein [Paracraurococcus sp. LOR1-02]